jgi:hypothetical protein
VDPTPQPPAPPDARPGQARPLAPRPEPFAYPTDAAGKKVAAALAPDVPPTPVLPTTAKPQERSSEIDRGELPAPKVTVALPSPPLPKARPAKPTPPAERVPHDLGNAAAENPAGAKLTERPRVRAASADAGPAELPRLASAVPDRAPLDDPTTEIAAARAVLTALPLPGVVGWFVRFGVPDPFELAGHLKGKTGAAGELGAAPVNVPPGR